MKKINRVACNALISIPLPRFYPNPSLSSEPLAHWHRVTRGKLKLPNNEMGQPFSPHTSPVVTALMLRPDFPILRLWLCWFLLRYCGNPGITTTPSVIYLMEIEKHGRLQFAHNFIYISNFIYVCINQAIKKKEHLALPAANISSALKANPSSDPAGLHWHERSSTNCSHFTTGLLSSFRFSHVIKLWDCHTQIVCIIM